MALTTCMIADQSASIIRQNMAKIKLFTVASSLLCHPARAHRVVQLLENRRSWGIERPVVMLAVHSDDDQAAAEQFKSGAAHDLAHYIIVRQKGHNETVGNAIICFVRSSTQPLTRSLPKDRVFTSHGAGYGEVELRQPVFGWCWHNLR